MTSEQEKRVRRESNQMLAYIAACCVLTAIAPSVGITVSVLSAGLVAIGWIMKDVRA